MAGEQQVQSVAAPAQMRDGVRPSVLDELRRRIEAGFRHPADHVIGHAGFLAGRAADIDQIQQRLLHRVRRHMGGGLRQVGMRVGHVVTVLFLLFLGVFLRRAIDRKSSIRVGIAIIRSAGSVAQRK
jgi:hypothetical protein